MRDPLLAPEGKIGLIISTLMDYDLVHYISESSDYEEFKQFVTNKISSIINDSLIPGLVEKQFLASAQLL